MTIILDTNLWSYIANRGERATFDDLVRRRGLEIMLPPSMLLEALQTRDPDVRRGILNLMTAPTWRHPLPEARLEADEVVGVVRQHRPGWMRQFPQRDRLATLEHFWTHRVWQMAKHDPDRLIEAGRHPVEEMKRQALLEQLRETRQQLSSSRVRPEVNHLVADLSRMAPEFQLGWGGQPLSAWRVQMAAFYWVVLVRMPQRAWHTHEDLTHWDWVNPWIRLGEVVSERASFNRLWYYDVEAEAVAHNWLRWAVRWVQATMRFSSSNPVDEQHSTYLIDCDAFLSADVRFVRAVQDVRPFCPVPLARAVAVDANNPSIVERIDGALESAAD